MKKLFLLASAFLLAITSVSAQQTDMMSELPKDPEVRYGTLPNGAKYYIRKNTKDPQRTNFHILYKVGAVLEEDRQDGLAHFLEHMAFNGSKNFQDNDLIEYCQSIGVEFGRNLNAGTSQQSTTYMITGVPTTRESIIDSMLLILHDWAGFISLEEEAIDDERGVIQEEWRMYEGRASTRVNRQSVKLLFGEDNIYANRDIIGAYENLEKFTYQDIRDFYKKWYRPDLQAFIIVGDIDPAVIEEKLIKLMADVKMPEGEVAQAPVIKVEDNIEPRFGVFTDPELTATTVELSCRLAPTNDKYNNTAFAQKTSLLNSLATQMLGERYSEMSKSASSPFQRAYAYHTTYYDPFDILVMSASAREGEAYKAFEAAYTELLRAIRGGFAQPELDRIKADYLAWIEQSYNNRNDRKNDAFVGAYNSHFYNNDPIMSAEDDYKLTKELIEGITLEEVNAQFASLLTDKNIVVEASLQSKEGVEIPTVEGLKEIYERVKASDIEPYTEEVITRPLLDASKLQGSKVTKTKEGKFGTTEWTLANGLKVVVKPTDYKADEIMFNATRLGGTSKIEDLGTLYSTSLLGSFGGVAGLSDFTATELQRILAGKNAYASPFIGGLTEGYRGGSSIKDVETMLQLLYLRSTAPRAEAEDWETLVDRLNTQINGGLKNPMRIFQDSMAMTMSGHDPRALTLGAEYMSKISLEALKAQYEKTFSNNAGMTFFFVGSIDLDTFKPLVEKYIGSLPVAKAKKPNYGKFITETPKGKILNHFETPQEEDKVMVVVASNGDMKKATQAEALNLDIAGQILDNLYIRTIREEAGGVYSVSNYVSSSITGPDKEFVNVCVFQTDDTKYEELIGLVYEGIEQITTDGPTAEELQKIINAMQKNFDNGVRQNGTWMSYIQEFYTWGLDGYTNYQKLLDSVTPATVKAAAKRAFDQGNVIEVVQLP